MRPILNNESGYTFIKEAYDEKRLAFFEIENGEFDREAYAAFKRANGWAYGP